ncbi:DnaA ATPase domain-containing protein [Fibrobacter succinogenes]|uniref:DnaA ATPase domain-containing protein n=1 Tax=Fibrobacter succinogenes TaxID=833 RepID=UPI0015689893|nr:DnaA/Hda family protein [Fibrobacter succinogenes]
MDNTVSLLDIAESPWQQVLDRVRSECKDFFGAVILDALGYEGMCNGYAMLTVPDELRENWVNSHYGDLLRKSFTTVFGSEFVDYRIRQIAPSDPIPEIKLTMPVIPKVVQAPKPVKRPKQALSLYARYTFENFVEGECNSTAFRACQAVAENPGDPSLNPLFVYGESGLGKTHLLQSIAAKIQKSRPEASIVYCHAYDFLRDATAMASALHNKTGNVRELAQKFRERYELCDVLLLDDVQLLEKGLWTQERLAILIRHLRAEGKQVVISCDRHPSKFKVVDTDCDRSASKSSIPSISKKLLTPLESCVAVGIDEPDLATRMHLISKKSEDLPFAKADREEICRYLSMPPRKNVRLIEGLLNFLGAMNMFCKADLNLNSVKRLVAPSEHGGHVELTAKNIIEAVALEYRVEVCELSSKRQSASISTPRKVAMFLCRELTTDSLQNIGAMFCRDYATVIAAINSLKKQMEKDASLARRIQDIRYMLEA